MMYCGYHAKNPAVVQCNQCARWLCPACDHRVRGFPFCQDCIVAGVELLRHHSSANPAHILRRKELTVYCNAAFVCSRIGCGLQRSNFESHRAFRNLRQLLSNGGSDSGNALLYSWRDRNLALFRG